MNMILGDELLELAPYILADMWTYIAAFIAIAFIAEMVPER